MSLHLTTTDVARCEAVSRTLLAPLSAPSVDDWRREVNRTLRDLFRVDHVLFGLDQEGDYFFSDDLDRTSVNALSQLVLEAAEPRGTARDPYLATLIDRRRKKGIHVYDTYMADRLVGESHRTSALYTEFLVPHRIHHFLALGAAVPQGEARLGMGYAHPNTNPFGEEAVMLLTAFLPALKAGVESLARLDAHRMALDDLSEALLIVDQDGRELHRNRALGRLLDADPERERVLAEARFMARRLGAMAFPLVRREERTPFAPAHREVATKQARYTLRGTAVGPGLFGPSGTVLIAVTPVQQAPVLPQPEELRSRYGLTKREAEVALLLAEGLSNEAIAERLFVSPHTARHHTENVLSKLQLNSRKGLALKLMQG